jgi:hypothetical protein
LLGVWLVGSLLWSVLVMLASIDCCGEQSSALVPKIAPVDLPGWSPGRGSSVRAHPSPGFRSDRGSKNCASRSRLSLPSKADSRWPRAAPFECSNRACPTRIFDHDQAVALVWQACPRAAAASSSRARGSWGRDLSETGCDRGGSRGRSGASSTVSSALCRSYQAHQPIEPRMAVRSWATT